MKVMGLSQLYLVNPHRPEGREARTRAMSGLDILDRAVLCSSLDEALIDCRLVMGTSARLRSLPWPLIDPREAAEMAMEFIGRPPHSEGGEMSSPPQVALLFGREANGLQTSELARCHHHIHIPTSAESTSLNLASAVQIIAYELQRASLPLDQTSPYLDRSTELSAPLADPLALEGYFQHLEQSLIALQFLNPDAPKHLMTRLRRLYMRAQLEAPELNILRGILSAIDRADRP